MAGKNAVVKVAIVGDNSSLSRSLRQSETAIGRFSATAVKAGKIVGVGLAVGLAAFAKKSVEVEAAFGKTMRSIAAVTNAPAGQIKQLNDLAIQLGQNTVFSANEAAQAMLELSKAGLDSKTIYEGAADATLKLATAAGTDLATSATIASNAMNAFGLEAKDLTDVTVALVGGANKSTASVETLQQGLAQVGAGARNAGLSFDETVAVLAKFDNAGIKGSDAGTSLKTMLQRLVPTTEKAADAMAQLGLDFTDAQGNFKPITEIAEELRQGFKGMSDAERTAALQTIFGSDATRAASVLMRGGAADLKKYIKATHDKSAADRASKAATEGTSGALERISSTIETAQLKLGQELAPAIAEVADWLGDNLVPATEAAIDTGKDFVDALDPLVDVLKVIGEVGADAAKFFNDLPGPVKTLTFQVGLAALAFWKLNPLLTESAAKLTAVGTQAQTAAGRTELLTTATGKLSGAAKFAAGAGGLLALTSGFQKAADDGASFGDVLEGAVGGAMTGLAVGGPIGALIGAAGGGGLVALAGAFGETEDEARGARLELLKTEGLKSAKEGADDLRESLAGVINVYGEIPRAAVKASFTDKETGALAPDIQLLREAGISMDTLVSATMGQADAGRKAEQALFDAMNAAVAGAAEAQRAYDAAKKNPAIATADLKEIKAALDDANDAAARAGAAQDAFYDRIKRNTGAIEEHRHTVGELSKALHVNREEFNKLPQKIRAKFETEGLEQTFADTARLIKNYKGLQNFKSIKTLLSAPGVKATGADIRKLAKLYKLTPDQVTTLIKLEKADKAKKDAKDVKNAVEDAGKAKPNFDPAKRAQNDYVRSLTAWGEDVKNKVKNGTRKAKADLGPLGTSIKTGTDKAKATARTGAEEVGAALKSGTLAGVGGLGDALAVSMSSAVRQGINAAKAEGEISSPSKATERLGRFLAEGLIIGVQKGSDGISAALARMSELVTKTLDAQLKARQASIKKRLDGKAEKAALGALNKHWRRHVQAVKAATKDERDALKAVGKRLDQLRSGNAFKIIGRDTKLGAAMVAAGVKNLDEARQALDDLKQSRADLIESVKSSATDWASVTNLDPGPAGAFNPKVMLATMQHRIEMIQKFNAILADLRSKGLSDEIVTRLAQAGVEGGLAQALAIQQGGKTAIDEFTRLQGDLDKAAGELGTIAGSSMYDAGIAAADGLVKGLEAREDQIEAWARKLARKLRKAIREELGLGGGTGGGTRARTLGFDASAVSPPGTAKTAATNKATTAAIAPAVNNTYQITVTAPVGSSPVEIGRTITAYVDAYEKAGGRRRK